MASDSTMSRTAIAERLRMAREAAGLSQGQTAKLMHMHRPTVSEIEAGRRRLAAEELAGFAEAYGVSASWLLGESDEALDDLSDRIKLAARQLSSLKDEDLDKLMRLFRSLRRADE